MKRYKSYKFREVSYEIDLNMTKDISEIDYNSTNLFLKSKTPLFKKNWKYKNTPGYGLTHTYTYKNINKVEFLLYCEFSKSVKYQGRTIIPDKTRYNIVLILEIKDKNDFTKFTILSKNNLKKDIYDKYIEKLNEFVNIKFGIKDIKINY